VRATLRTPLSVDGVELSVGCSIGVALARAEHTAETFLHDADTALYAAKEQGRNRYAFYRGGGAG
jgi:GGDEF domain-containing protein